MIYPVDDTPGVGLVLLVPAHGVDEHRFSASALANEPEDLTGADGGADVLEDLVSIEALGDLVQYNENL